MPKLTLHMVCSLDGLVAKPDGDVSWMASTDRFDAGKTLTEADVTVFLEGIDSYILGSNTYEHALELGWPYGQKPVYVLTSRDLPLERESVHLHAGDPKSLMEELQRQQLTNIWLGGGPTIAKAFLQQQLIDEIVVSIMPVILGKGLPFFDQIGIHQQLHLVEVTPYSDGMVEMRYEVGLPIRYSFPPTFFSDKPAP